MRISLNFELTYLYLYFIEPTPEFISSINFNPEGFIVNIDVMADFFFINLPGIQGAQMLD